ncbi:hypothetical protein [Desulfotruncus alcoholivorax]|nr:hypothetical protein [Desulfotruncus alcoholivorax]
MKEREGEATTQVSPGRGEAHKGVQGGMAHLAGGSPRGAVPPCGR